MLPGQLVLNFDLPPRGYATEWYWPWQPQPKALAGLDEETPLSVWLSPTRIEWAEFHTDQAQILRGRGIRR